MPSKTWADGDLVIAADLNTHFRDQVVTTCTSGTRPTTSTDGRMIFETDTGAYYRWRTGTSAWELVLTTFWQTYAPTWTSSGSAPALGTGGVINGRYMRAGKTCTVHFHLYAGSAAVTPGTGVYRFSLPFAAANSAGYRTGSAYVLWPGTGSRAGVAFAAPNTTYCEVDVNGALTEAFPFAFGADDQVHITMTYEVN